MPGSNIAEATSLAPKILTSTRPSATTATTVYTVPSGGSAIVKHGVLCNVTTAPVTVSVSLVPSGGTAGATNRVISGYSLAAGDSLPLADLLGGACLGPGDFISVITATADAVTVTLTGTEHA